MPRDTNIVRLVPDATRDAQLLCHAEGHQWRPNGRLGGGEPGARPPFGNISSVATLSMCVSCGSERHRWYTRSGEVINRYHHADGYLHKRETPDDAAPSRLDWRKRLVVTLFDDMTPSAKRARK